MGLGKDIVRVANVVENVVFCWINVDKVHFCATVKPLCLLAISHFVHKNT